MGSGDERGPGNELGGGGRRGEQFPTFEIRLYFNPLRIGTNESNKMKSGLWLPAGNAAT